jgi:hypothetical protein
VSAYTDPGFGRFLRTDPDLQAAYRERTGRLLADMPRLVAFWRAMDASADRDGFSPAEAEKLVRAHAAAVDEDVEDLRAFAAIWAAGRR